MPTITTPDGDLTLSETIAVNIATQVLDMLSDSDEEEFQVKAFDMLIQADINHTTDVDGNFAGHFTHLATQNEIGDDLWEAVKTYFEENPAMIDVVLLFEALEDAGDDYHFDRLLKLVEILEDRASTEVVKGKHDLLTECIHQIHGWDDKLRGENQEADKNLLYTYETLWDLLVQHDREDDVRTFYASHNQTLAKAAREYMGEPVEVA